MLNFINIGKKDSAIELLKQVKENDYVSFDVKLLNLHLKRLNMILGKNVIKNNSAYVNLQTLWEIMQDIGTKGQHHFHGLTPENVYEALRTLKDSKDVRISYDSRYVIISLAKFGNNTPIAVIIEPNGYIKKINNTAVKIVTIYPYKKK